MIHLLKVVLLLTVAAIGFFFGQRIPFQEQWNIYESLQITASIILGVMGAWAAIIYPGILSRVFESRADGNERRQLARLLIPMIYSAGVVAAVLLVGFFAPIIRTIASLVPYVEILRGISYGILGILMLLQLWALIFALAPGDLLMQNIERVQERKGLLNRLQSRISKPKKG